MARARRVAQKIYLARAAENLSGLVSRMRVALNGLFLDYPATGTGQYLRELVPALEKISPHDEFRLLAPQADATAPATVEIYPTRVAHDNFAKLEFEQITFPRASKKFDLAHVPHFGSPLFPSRPTVVTIHDLIPLVLPAYRGSIQVRMYSRLAAWAAQRAIATVADSHASARDIEQQLHIPREKIHVVHLAANARYQPPSRDELERVRAKYKLPKQFVLYLGGFDVRKNVARVMETFGRLEIGEQGLETGDWRLVIAGKLPATESAFFPNPRGLAKELGVLHQTHFLGFVAEEDKPALYAAARVFLYPSQYEGFGLPPLEAMACGTPVIVSNASSLPEVVGDAGILLDADDAASWSDALEKLLTDDVRCKDLGARGLEQAKKFSWERAARETLEVYRSVV